MATAVESLTPRELRSLLDRPVVAPPAGSISNLEDPPNLDTVSYLTLYLCVSCATLAVVMRIYTKHFLIHRIDYEDYASGIGLIGLWGLFIPSLITQRSGLGIHAWDLPLSAFSRTLYWFYVATIIYLPVVFFIKLSILLQYYRIFVPNRKGNFVMFVSIQICIWSIFSFHMVYLFMGIFTCNPREKLWNPLITTGHCQSSNTIFKSSGIFNAVSDFAILILPMPCLWRLQTPMRRKILMMGVFATGLLACATSIARTYYSFQTSKSSDSTYNLGLMGFWALAEITIGIIVGCLPITPKFIHHIGAKISTTFASTSKGSVGAAHGLMNRNEPSRTNTLAKIHRPFANHIGPSISESSNDTYSPQAQPHEMYLKSDKRDPLSLGLIKTHEPTHPSSVIIAVRRDDLEYGEQTI